MAGGDTVLPPVPDHRLVAGDPAGLKPLSEALDHRFARNELLVEALTHRSAVAGGDRNRFGYERLEFLGDRVLGLIVADLLMKRFRDENEGSLARRFTALVRREALTEVAERIGLGDHLLLAPSEEDTGGRSNPGTLADACEAVIAALYLDGGIEAASRFIARYWEPLIAAIDTPPRDAKTKLQEWAQARGLPLPVYETVAREGPPHSPTFSVRVSADGFAPAQADGPSKRVAEQGAAQALLKIIAERDDG